MKDPHSLCDSILHRNGEPPPVSFQTGQLVSAWKRTGSSSTPWPSAHSWRAPCCQLILCFRSIHFFRPLPRADSSFDSCANIPNFSHWHFPLSLPSRATASIPGPLPQGKDVRRQEGSANLGF